MSLLQHNENGSSAANNETFQITANLSSAFADPQDNPDVSKARAIYYTGFWIIGTVIILLNAFLAYVLLFVSKIRRQSNNRPIVASLALSDVFQGAAFVSCAICYFFDPSMDHVTALQCMTFVHVVLFNTGPLLIPLCLVAVSIDRLLCIINTDRYLALGSRYRMTQCLWPWVATGAMYAAMWVVAVQANRQFNQGPKVICYRELIVSNNIFISCFDLVQSVVPLVAVVIYVVGICILYIRRKSVFVGISKEQRCREQQITKTLGLMGTSTLILYIIPTASQALIHYLPHLNVPRNTLLMAVLNNVLSFTMSIHSICNFGVYVWRADDVRERLIVLLGLRRLHCRRNSTVVVPVTIRMQAFMEEL